MRKGTLIFLFLALFGIIHAEEMKEYAARLSQGIPFLRVDMYCCGKTVYVGELTFYHYGGYIPFNPEEWDCKLGEMLDISEIRSRK